MNNEKKMISEFSHEKTKQLLKDICSVRVKEGETPHSDFEVLQPKFIDYKEDGTFIVNFPVFEWQCNGLGNLQGGMRSYMIDCVFGMLAFNSTGENPVASVDMTTNFLKSANTDVYKEVTVYARIVNMGRRLLHAEASMYCGEDRLVATASTNMCRL